MGGGLHHRRYDRVGHWWQTPSAAERCSRATAHGLGNRRLYFPPNEGGPELIWILETVPARLELEHHVQPESSANRSAASIRASLVRARRMATASPSDRSWQSGSSDSTISEHSCQAMVVDRLRTSPLCCSTSPKGAPDAGPGHGTEGSPRVAFSADRHCAEKREPGYLVGGPAPCQFRCCVRPSFNYGCGGGPGGGPGGPGGGGGGVTWFHAFFQWSNAGS
jgi:hypothetical protein